MKIPLRGLGGLPPHPDLPPPPLPSSQPSGGPTLRKVPRVSLERLDLDLSGEAQPPVFRVFPGTSAEEFSLIVIERGAQPQPAPPPPPAIKVSIHLFLSSPLPASFPVSPHAVPLFQEEQKELSIGDAEDTKPVVLPPKPPSGVVTGPEIPPAPTVAPTGTHRNVSCCRVCCQAGAVVMCDLCERCYHLDCHLPMLHVVPRYIWSPPLDPLLLASVTSPGPSASIPRGSCCSPDLQGSPRAVRSLGSAHL